MRRSILAVAMLAALAGCQTTGGPMVNSFDPAAAAFAGQSGSGSVVGQAFLRQVGGGVVTAAGESVLIFPDQPYSRELANRLRAGISAPGEEGPLRPFTQSTVADASGTFGFDGLASGQYIVLTAVRWGAPSQYGPIPQGGVVYTSVTVETGRATRVIIN